MSSVYLGSVADLLLDALVDGLAAVTTGRVAPSDQFVSHGVPARLGHCCDDGYAVVYLDPREGIAHNVGAELYPQDCATIGEASWVLEWGRCVPGLTETGWPSTDEVDVSANDLLEDLWSVLTELYDRRASGVLGSESCGDVRILEAIPLEPQGGCAGWQIRVVTILDDAGPSGS